MLGMDKLTGLSVEGNGIGVGLAKHPVHSTDYVLRGEAILLLLNIVRRPKTTYQWVRICRSDGR